MKQELLEKNLKSLAVADSDLARRVASAPELADYAIVKARSGLETLVLEGVTMHSRFDPAAEAGRAAASEETRAALTEGKIPVVFGLGLGYHVLALTAISDMVIVVEPRPEVLRLAFGSLDFTGAMSRLRFFTAPQPLNDWPPAFLWPHQPSVRLNKKDFELWSELLKRHGSRDEKLQETVSEAAAALTGITGAAKVMNGLRPEQPFDEKELARAVFEGEGPLTEFEILVLLLNALSWQSQ